MGGLSQIIAQSVWQFQAHYWPASDRLVMTLTRTVTALPK
jgi:hypothetical protein